MVVGAGSVVVEEGGCSLVDVSTSSIGVVDDDGDGDCDCGDDDPAAAAVAVDKDSGCFVVIDSACTVVVDGCDDVGLDDSVVSTIVDDCGCIKEVASGTSKEENQVWNIP